MLVRDGRRRWLQEKDARDAAEKEGELQQEIQGQIARISVRPVIPEEPRQLVS
jgi:hypothetical protein